MLLHQDKESGGKVYQDVVNSRGNIDYVKSGKVYKNAPAQSVMIGSQSDLASLTGYTPGTIAYTAGFSSVWQLSAAGTWVEV